MKKYAYLSIRYLSYLMFFGGIFLCFLFNYNEWVAKIDRMMADAAMWRMLFYVAIGLVVNSIPMYGFSFIVEAACKYLYNLEQKDDYDRKEEAED